MATVSGRSSAVQTERPGWRRRILVPEMWASLGIAAMWLAVLFVAIAGPDLVSASATSTTRIPSVFVVAPFAYLGTRAVAKYGFGHSDKTPTD